MTKYKKPKEHIIEICKRLYHRNLLAAGDGNVSYRESDSEIWITPSGLNKGYLAPEDLALIDLSNNVLEGTPSTERLMHLEIYKTCPKAKAVIHAHPPTAIAWSVARPDMRELPKECLSELILALGSVPIVPYCRPGTEEMGTKLIPLLPRYRVMILARHGGVSWGESLEEAFNGMERLEHTCEILFKSQLLGGLTFLPTEEIEFLKELRHKMGDKSL